MGFLLTGNLKDIHIDVSNNSDGSSAQQCFHIADTFTGRVTRVYACPCGMYGRYVRIRYPEEQTSHMYVCELQVQSGGENKIFTYLIHANPKLHFG